MNTPKEGLNFKIFLNTSTSLCIHFDEIQMFSALLVRIWFVVWTKTFARNGICYVFIYKYIKGALLWDGCIPNCRGTKGLVFIWITNKTFEELKIFNWFLGFQPKRAFKLFQINLSRLYVDPIWIFSVNFVKIGLDAKAGYSHEDIF